MYSIATVSFLDPQVPQTNRVAGRVWNSLSSLEAPAAYYHLPHGFTPVVVPHGNSKSNQPFFPTLLSTKALIDNSSGTDEMLQMIQQAKLGDSTGMFVREPGLHQNQHLF